MVHTGPLCVSASSYIAISVDGITGNNTVALDALDIYRSVVRCPVETSTQHPSSSKETTKTALSSQTTKTVRKTVTSRAPRTDPTTEIRPSMGVSSPGDRGVEITADPDAVHENFTRKMSINCSFLPSQNTDIKAVVSLILWKSQPHGAGKYEEFASISEFSRFQVDVSGSHLRGEIKGALPVDGKAFISVVWVYPGAGVVGRYKCQAHGLDPSGHLVSISATTEIVSRDVDIEAVLERMKDIDLTLASQLDECKSDLRKMEKQLNQTRDEIEKFKDDIDQCLPSCR